MTTTVPKHFDHWPNKALKYIILKLFFNLKHCYTVLWLILKKKENENILNVGVGAALKF